MEKIENRVVVKDEYVTRNILVSPMQCSFTHVSNLDHIGEQSGISCRHMSITRRRL